MIIVKDVKKKNACISISMLSICLRLTDLNIYFYDVFSLVIKWVPKKGIWKCQRVFSLQLYENVPDESLLYCFPSIIDDIVFKNKP